MRSCACLCSWLKRFNFALYQSGWEGGARACAGPEGRAPACSGSGPAGGAPAAASRRRRVLWSARPPAGPSGQQVGS